MRFVNWLQNGQPAGLQNAQTTEDGAYDLSILPKAPPRKAGALWFLPNQSEWTKAGYFQPLPNNKGIYWTLATHTDGPAVAAQATATGDVSNPGANVVNFGNTPNGGFAWNGQSTFVSTAGGCGPLSESYYGTRDQDGNLSEWVENVDVTAGSPSARILGTNFTSSDAAREVSSYESTGLLSSLVTVGFRVGNFFTGQADLALSLTHSGNFALNAQGVYSVLVSNNGPSAAADGSVVTVTLPADETYVSYAGTNWTVVAGGNVITATSSSPVQSGASLPVLLLTVSVSANAPPGTETPTVVLTNSSPDSNTQNNSTSDPTNLVADQPPVPAFTTDVSTGTIPFSVHFDASSSSDPDQGDVLTYTWDFGDGSAPGTGVTVDHLFTTAGYPVVTLAVADSQNVVRTATQTIHANTQPVALAQSVSCFLPGIAGISLHGTDADNDPLVYSISQQPAHGTLTGTPPLVVYTPNTDATGADSFAFTVFDGLSTSQPATVTITYNSHSYEVFSWGTNDFGQLGDGTNIVRTKPVQLANLTGAAQVACATAGALLLMRDGTVYSWGQGPIGDGTGTPNNTPQALGLTNVVSVAAGDVAFFAVLGDGTVDV